MLTYEACDQCDSLSVNGRVDPKDEALIYYFCRDCGSEWED